MRFKDYLESNEPILFTEGKMLRLDQMFKRGDLDKKVFIVFDTETSGLFKYERGSQNPTLKSQMSPGVKKALIDYYKNPENLTERELQDVIARDEYIRSKTNAPKRRKELDSKSLMQYATMKINRIEKKMDTFVQLSEIAAIAIDIDGNELGRFHKFVKINKSKITDSVLRLIHWSDEKDEQGQYVVKVLEQFTNFIKKFPANNVMFIAHNAAFDASLVTRLAKLYSNNKYGGSKMQELFKIFKTYPIIDSRRNTKLREVMNDVFPTKTFAVGKSGGTRTIEDNKLVSIQNALNIINDEQHTAIADVKALVKVILSLFKTYKERTQNK